ncbi:MAG: type IV pilin [Thermoplasmata archaeon]|nr:type IV pilin [Thermoplasmata archaeon]
MQSVNGTPERGRWGKGRKRAVSPIIATILLVAITVVLAAVLYILISGLTKGPGNTPIGTALAVGTPVGATNKWAHWYNASVASAGGGITMGATNWQFVTATGSIVSPAANWTLNVLSITATVVGTYNLVTGIWTLGSTTPLTSQMQISIYSANTILSGDHAIVSGSGSYSGSISVNIP